MRRTGSGGTTAPSRATEPAGVEPVLPDYGAACLSSLVPALYGRNGPDPAEWLPEAVLGASQVVLLVLDGLGWHQLRAEGSVAPVLSQAAGRPITSVAPTTTATALTSIATGAVPAHHGILGYRMSPGSGRPGEVMNVLRWSSDAGDLRRVLPAGSFQRAPAFGGLSVAAVTRSEFATTGFTAAHLGSARLVGWRVPSTMIVEVSRLLASGEPFVYAYYDGIDKVAHEHGLGEHFRMELRAADRLVGDLVEVLPPGAALVVTADHGQVQIEGSAITPAPEIMASVSMISGEGRFRWLHARPGAGDDLLAAVTEMHGHEAWVRSREQTVEEGWFGGTLAVGFADRLGDVAIVARDPVAFLDPADTGESLLRARHGSLTEAEMRVPLIGLAS